MRRLRWIGLSAVLALATTGIALAAHGGHAAKTDAVAATFTGARTDLQEKTCTGSDGAYRDAHETFSGTMTSTDPRLQGDLVLRTHSLVNQTTGNGTTRGQVWVRDADGKLLAKARLTGVNSSGGVLSGVLVGRVRDGGRLVANVTATIAGAALSGELGSGSAANSAVVQTGRCGHDED